MLKNGHTEAELDEMEERWVNHPGPYLTLAEVLAIEAQKARQAENNAAAGASSTQPSR